MSGADRGSDVGERRRRGRDQEFAVTSAASAQLPGKMGAWDVTGESGRTYRVTIYDPDAEVRECDCPDFRRRKLGTCKHIEAVLVRLGASTVDE